jgi:hypothetical protein
MDHGRPCGLLRGTGAETEREPAGRGSPEDPRTTRGAAEAPRVVSPPRVAGSFHGNALGPAGRFGAGHGSISEQLRTGN